MNIEAALITSVCENGDVSTVLSQDVDDLFVSHGDIWEAVKGYYSKYRAAPSVEMIKERFSDFEPEKVNGPTEYVLDKLREDFLKNKLGSLLLNASVASKSDSPQRVLEKMQAKLSELSRYNSAIRDVNIKDINSAVEHYEHTKMIADEHGGTLGIPTGIEAIDKSYTTGFAPGHLAVVIGYQGRAKSGVTALFAINAWKAGFRPMVVSLEMSPELYRDRIITIMGEGEFWLSDLSRGNIQIDDFRSWGKKKLSKQNDFIIVSNDGSGDMTPNTIQAKIDQYKPDIVILDYQQLLTDNRKSNSEIERNKNVSRELKMLAMRNLLPVVNISAVTMTDGSTDDPPMVEQVAWSKAIMYDADVAMAVHKHTDTNIVEVVCRKNRHGEEFDVFLDTDLGRGVIKEMFENPEIGN